MKLQPLMLLCLAASSCSFGEAKKGRQMDAKYGFVDDGLSSAARGTRKSAFISDGRRMDAKRGSGKSANRLSSPKKGRLMSEHDWNKEPYGGLILGRGFTEVKFVNGTAHAFPPPKTHPSNGPQNFFKKSPSTAYMGFGYNDDDSLPYYVWYEFEEPIIPGRFLFYTGGGGFSPPTWFFVGSNDQQCGQYSTWTPLCGEMSGQPPACGYKCPKMCHVTRSLAKPYRCLGLMVLKAGWTQADGRSSRQNMEVDVMNCKMWKVNKLPNNDHWPGKPGPWAVIERN